MGLTYPMTDADVEVIVSVGDGTAFPKPEHLGNFDIGIYFLLSLIIPRLVAKSIKGGDG